MAINESHSQHLYRSDPIAYILTKKLNLSSFDFAVWSLLISLSIYLFIGFISHTLFNESKNGILKTGLIEDWHIWFNLIFIDPLICGYYLWSFLSINNLIASLSSSLALKIDKLNASQIIGQLYYGKWRRLLALSISILISIKAYFTYEKMNNSWTSYGTLPILVYVVGTLIIMYLGLMIFLNLIANILILNKIFKRENLDVIPLHPDRCGGLKALSDYSIKTAYLISALGIYISVYICQVLKQVGKQELWYISISLFVYIFMSLSCFFGPLYTANKEMKMAKESLLLNISQQFHKDYSIVQNSLNDDSDVLNKKIQKVKELRAFHLMTDDFPVWPFDTKTLSRFFITMLGPLVPPLINKVVVPQIELLLKFMGFVIK